MVDRWKDQEDAADVGKPIDYDYIAVDSTDSVKDAYCGQGAVADGGEAIDRGEGSGNGEHWKNRDAIDTGVDRTPSRTILTGTRPGSRKWRLHEDMKVTVYDEDAEEWYTTPHSDGDRRAERCLLDAKIQSLGLGQTARDAVYHLVTTDEKMNVWNRWYGGHGGAIVGYAAWYLNPADRETAKAYAESVGAELGVSEEDGRDAVEYAFERADERGLGE